MNNSSYIKQGDPNICYVIILSGRSSVLERWLTNRLFWGRSQSSSIL